MKKNNFNFLRFPKHLIVFSSLFFLLLNSGILGAQSLNVYGPVPGHAPSEFYSFRVRVVGESTWQTPFAFITRCKDIGGTTRYYEHLANWSNTYINFEMDGSSPIEIEISKVGGAAIKSAVAHPAHKVASCNIVDGKAYVIINDPALFTVDIDGQMDNQDTGLQSINPTTRYSGPAIHTLTVFANPSIENKPSPTGPDVYAVDPGTTPPQTGTWSTLYFKPGVHDLGKDFTIHANTNYYIPGDAIVYAALDNGNNWSNGSNIRIFGHGTLSGARLAHPVDDGAASEDSYKYRPIDVRGANNVHVEGITIDDSPHHSIMLIGAYNPSAPNTITWTKIFTWRGNGDGINPFQNTKIENCFLRTQDDSFYTNGHGIKNVVLWNDCNGSSFCLPPIGGIQNPHLIIEDIDIIYARSIFSPGGGGGRTFNLRGEGGGDPGTHKVTFRNIRKSDPRPTRSSFFIASTWTNTAGTTKSRTPGDVKNVFFENITIAKKSILNEDEILWGKPDAKIKEFTFKNVTIDGVALSSLSDFRTNQYVDEATIYFIIDGYSIITSELTNGTLIFNPGGGTYVSGTEVSITAVGDLGYTFESWGGDLSGTENPVTIKMDSDKTISATFTSTPVVNLFTESENGTIVLDPPGNIYNPGTKVILTAVPDSNYVFNSWGGDLSGKANPDTLIMNSDKTVSATFSGKPVFSVRIGDCPSGILATGQSHLLSAFINPADAYDQSVFWSSSNNAVATVDENGLIRAISQGSATITVTTKDGGYTSSCNIGVVSTGIPVNSVTISECPQGHLKVDSTYQLSADIIPDNAGDLRVNWSSSDETIASVDANGLVTAVSQGEVTITVISNLGGLIDECTVNVDSQTNIWNMDTARKFVKVYPNPVSKTLNIEHVEGAYIIIYNTMGQMIYSKKALGNMTSIDVANFNGNNLLLVHVIFQDKSTVEKVSISKY